jgi:hypothetical protein
MLVRSVLAQSKYFKAQQLGIPLTSAAGWEVFHCFLPLRLVSFVGRNPEQFTH